MLHIKQLNKQKTRDLIRKNSYKIIELQKPFEETEQTGFHP